MNLQSPRHKSILRRIGIGIAVVFAVIALFFITDTRRPDQKALVGGESHDHASAAKHTLWTCAMHPQIKLPNAGKCPICFMDLIPISVEEQTAANMVQVSMSKTAKKLAQVQTAEVKREPAKMIVRMVGSVYEDETRAAALTSRVDGRLDEVYIDFTGVRVNKGDPMVKIWSPTLIKSQVELFETKKGETDPAVLKGGEEKLLQLGLTQEQVDQIRERKKPDLYVTLRAPISGVVLKKMFVLGQFVKEGSEMFIINDLSHVWIKMDAYETDLPWIKYGQKVKFTSPGFPGRTFEGRVLFIDPMLDTKTRSVKVRVAADNPDYALKPGMFVTAELESELDSKGKVIKREWAGKYVCPIHPKDEASSAPGSCPDSKMALQPASTFGYSDDPKPDLPLVIPATAPLITGTRTIVYVEVPGDKPTYELREIVLGPKAGDKYVVYEGLKEGEKVVTYGNFKIDSAMQIVGKPSMMSSISMPKPTTQPVQEESVEKMTAPVDFLNGLNPVIKDYLTLKNALVDEDTRTASNIAGELAEKFSKIDSGKLDTTARASWTDLSGSITKYAQGIKATSDVDLQRRAFDPLSEGFAKLIMSFRHTMPGPLYLYNCAQAAGGQGAYWLETTQEFSNPYFGTKPYKGQDLLKCGELSETIPSENGEHAPAAGDAGAQPTKNPDPSH